jgi:hypothetical protein
LPDLDNGIAVNTMSEISRGYRSRPRTGDGIKRYTDRAGVADRGFDGVRIGVVGYTTLILVRSACVTEKTASVM